MKKLLGVAFLLLLIVNFISATPNINATQIPEGAVIKTKDNPDVYIVKYKYGKQFKRLVLNPQVFESYGHLRWEDILIVDQATMNSFAISNLVRVDGQVDVYQLVPNEDVGIKVLLTSIDSYDLDLVYTINEVDFGNYVTCSDNMVKLCLEQPFVLQGRCINQQAIDKKDYQICDKILELGHFSFAYIEIAYCIREVAIATDNQFLCVKIDNQCAKLDNQNEKNVCYNEKNVCYRELAVKLNDYFLCDQIAIIVDNDSAYRDFCYQTIGINKKSLGACNKIQNSFLKNICIDTVLK